MKGRSLFALVVCAWLCTVSSRAAAALTPTVAANGAANAFIAAFVGALLGELLGKNMTRKSAERELAAEEELRRKQLTERDESGLKSIATAIEEYRVDNNGAYPKSLDALSPTYLKLGMRVIPGSSPLAYYTYEHPASDPSFGSFDIKDNGGYDPTLDHLLNALDRAPCTRRTCKYIIYTETFGLAGLP